jgi:hypothetical protein
MSPGPGPRRRAYGTISPHGTEGLLVVLDDMLLTMASTPTTTTRRMDVRHVGQLNFDEDYDEWSLYAAPTNNTNSDLGQLLSPIVMGAAAVSEGVTTLPLTRSTLQPAVEVVTSTSSSVVQQQQQPLFEYHSSEGDELYFVDEMEEDWRILHESRRNLVILEGGGGDYDGEDVSLQY